MSLAETPQAVRRSRVAYFDREAAGVVVSLRGEHDISTVDELRAVLHCAVALYDEGLVVDLRSAEFIDASTMGAIVACRNELGLLGRSLIIRSPTTSARRLLNICGLQSLLDPQGLVRPPPSRTPEAAPGKTLVGNDVST